MEQLEQLVLKVPQAGLEPAASMAPLEPLEVGELAPLEAKE